MFRAEGVWARFLRQAQGYIATEVKSEGDFRERFSDDFARFDREVVEGLVEKEEFVGAYYEADGTQLGNA